MISKIRDFLADTAGTYGTLFAVASLPVMGSVSAALEYSSVYRTKAAIQQALDAAALAAAKELAYSNDVNYLKAYGRDFFDANLNSVVDPKDVDFNLQFFAGDVGGGRIDVTAYHVYDTYMAGVIGIDTIPMHVSASIATGNRTIEVALVVDNSGSMDTRTGSTGMTRMELARQAANDLVTQLNQVAAYSNKPDPVKFALVPFAGSVNVGPQYRGADWLDPRGWSPVHHENIDWNGASTGGDSWPSAVKTVGGWKSSSTSTVSVGPTPPAVLPDGISSYSTTWLSRWTLFDALNTPWAGCVEMRPDPYNTSDAAPNDLDTATLFVPMFSPDEPDRKNSSEDADYGNNYLSDYIRVGTDYSATTSNYGSTTKQAKRQDWPRKYNLDARLKDSSNRILIGRQRSRDAGVYGPNQGCTTPPLTPLTTNSATIVDSISKMVPGGFTNIQAGLSWGWHVLSEGVPFTQGRSYDQAENDKYIILLTDGNNTYPAQATLNKTEYYAWGYGKDNRVSAGLATTTSDVDAMNQQTARTCANIKAITDADNEPAYKIFTIVYDVPDGSSVKTLLQNCASIGKYGERYYYDVQGEAITDAMAAIGSVISELRVAR
jgi:Mg-chelatase subunit ChlD